MGGLGVTFEPLKETAAGTAAAAPGSRERFLNRCTLIAADRLLTRDRGCYRRYFAGLKVLDPSI